MVRGRTVRFMSFGFRKSVKLGPVRLTASKRGLTGSLGAGALQQEQQGSPHGDSPDARNLGILAVDKALTRFALTTSIDPF